MKSITRDEVRTFVERGDALIVDVLPEDNFEKFHLPHAMNVPFDDSFDEEIQRTIPNKSAAVVVYCMDDSCPESTKAAKRMEELGYDHVYDYEGGKVDWRQAGLEVEPASVPG